MTPKGSLDLEAGGWKRFSCVPALVVFLLLVGAAYGYWRFVYYPTTPQYALAEFLDAARAEDYATCYRRLYVPDAMRLIIPSAESLRSLAQAAGGIVPRLEDYRLGRVQVSGDEATVSTVLTTRNKSDSTATVEEVSAEMVRKEGTWKVDGAWAMRQAIRRGGESILKALYQ